MSATTASPGEEAARKGRLYRMIWRWHFYAGLFCLPFVIVLALSGTVYLFRPQIETWIDRDLIRLERTGDPQDMAAIVGAAEAAVPGSALAHLILPEHVDEALRVVVSDKGMRTRVYVHPDTLAILKVVPEESRFARVVFRIHGELLMGSWGSVLVELAASWAIVMIVSGLYLWWPRGARGLAGVLYPRLAAGGRVFWRDLHAVVGLWVSALALFLLVTGLPWAMVWGEAFKSVRQWTGTASAQQDWSTSSAGEHAEHRFQDSIRSESYLNRQLVHAVVETAIRQDLAPPVLLSPPTTRSPYWWARSNAANRPLRDDVAIDPQTAAPVARWNFEQKHIIDRVVGVGIAAHEGQLFGVFNQVLGVVAALGLVTLSASGFIMWRRRKPPHVLGAPPPAPGARPGVPVVAGIIALALFLPLFLASLILVAAVERWALARWPAARRWLGLSPRGVG